MRGGGGGSLKKDNFQELHISIISFLESYEMCCLSVDQLRMVTDEVMLENHHGPQIQDFLSPESFTRKNVPLSTTFCKLKEADLK